MNCDPSNPKGAGIVDVWQENLPVRFGSIDKSNRLTLNAVFQYFQEAAISHADNLGVGREEMAASGQVWLLSRMTVSVNKRSDYLDTITIRSWPRGHEKLFVIRNYEIKDKAGNSVVAGKSAWLVVDLGKRRPLRPEVIMERMPSNHGLDTFTAEDNAASGLEERSNLVKVSERKALYTDIDYNGHVNNVRYIQWIEDTLDTKLLENAGKMRLDINYLNEVLLGDKIDIYSGTLNENTFTFDGKKENGQSAFRAELKLE